MANDDDRATTCKRNFQASWLQTERTKNEGHSEKMSFNGELFENFKPKKNQKIQSSYGEQNKRTTRPWNQKLNMNYVARKKLTEAKLKKAFRIKLFESCKTRTKKSSPDPFNFYVISDGHDMANDAGRAATGKRNFKAPWLQTERNVQKMKGLLKKWALTGKSLTFSKQTTKNPVVVWRTKQRNHKTLKAKTEHEPYSQEEFNWSKFEKSIHNEAVWTLQD